MKVLFVVDSFFDGGAGHVVARVASAFSRQGIGTAVLPVFDNRRKYKIDDSVHVYETFDKPLEHSVFERVKLIRNAANDFNADCVISFLAYINIYSIIAGIGKKWSTIISERNNPYSSPSRKVVRIVRDIIYPLADGYVFQTEDAKGYYCNSIRRRGVVIPNPVGDDIPDPYIGERKKRIVSAGRLTKQKNYPMALKAMEKVFKEHPDYIYEIYGQGEEEENLRNIISDLHIENNVKLMGHSEKLLEDIKDASLFILSSDYEGMSNSLMEAMALGLPVISTDHPIGGAKALIENEQNGVLIPVGDDKALYKTVSRLIDNKDDLEKLGKNASQIRRVFSIDNVANKWMSYIATI